MNNKNKKYVIAGSGEYGYKALKHYGHNSVAFFVDNNPTKQGQDIEGVHIYSFKELEVEDLQYTVVIALNNYESVLLQLNTMGIKDCIIFSPSLIERLKNLPLPQNVDESIILFGCDVYTNQIMDEVINRGWNEEKIVLAERKRIIEESKFDANEINNIDIVITDNSTVLVSSVIHAYGIEQYKERTGMQVNKWINPFVDDSYYPKDELVINTYSSDTKETTEDKWVKDRNIVEAKERLNDYYSELNESLPLFSHIEIETVNRCNGKCSFCPVSVGHDIRPYSVMEEELFKKIIDDLGDMNYSGRIALFSNNEPFIDKRIVQFHKYARERLPKARFHLYTNGTLLSLDLFISIIDFLDELIIDNYNQKLELNETSKVIYKYVLEHPELKTKVDIVIRKEEEILNTRGGDAPNREVMVSYEDVTCTHPLRQMIIRPDGKVSLCCNDPYGKVTLGDVNKDSLNDIWYGEQFNKVRSLLKIGRGQIDICKYCDFFGCR